MSPYLIDTTLRDGEQAPGVTFTLKEKLQIASILNELGIDEVEAGTPAIGADEQESIKLIASAGFSFSTSCWCRTNYHDIDIASKLGTDAINLSLPVSDIQLNALGKTRSWVLSELQKLIPAVCQNFRHVTMGAQDATRANLSFLKEFIFLASDSGARRIRISDTVGISDPQDIMNLFAELSSEFPDINFEFHGHNDLGMATANSISALNAGAECLSATINGLGERAGNAALEEIVATLHYRKNVTRFNTKVINRLCEFVAKAANRTIPSDKPLIGKSVFTHESGIHTSLLIKNRETYQFIDSKDFGNNTMNFLIGKHSGKASIIEFFRRHNIDITSTEASAILNVIKQKTNTRKTSLTSNQILKIYYNLQSNVNILDDL